MISQEEMKKLATLSRIEFTEEELDSMKGDMESIFGYIDQLNEVEVNTDRSSASATERTNVLREDEITSEAGKYTDRMIDSAPKTMDGYIEVKKILNN
jgi:aspartyl-tRNA(Asn)/glutamyl-tRNA(Gln) amidotransferase subunit C